jgi:hypothetical protein
MLSIRTGPRSTSSFDPNATGSLLSENFFAGRTRTPGHCDGQASDLRGPKRTVLPHIIHRQSRYSNNRLRTPIHQPDNANADEAEGNRGSKPTVSDFCIIRGAAFLPGTKQYYFVAETSHSYCLVLLKITVQTGVILSSSKPMLEAIRDRLRRKEE